MAGAGRIRLRLELDPRDNLQRTLYATGTQVQEVEVTAFDTWPAEHRVERLDLVKPDVEGAELAALQGMAGVLARLRPPLWWSRSRTGSWTGPASTAARSTGCWGASATNRPARCWRWPTRATVRRQRPARRQ